MYHFCALLSIAAWAYRERDAPVVQRNERLDFAVDDSKQVPPAPQVVTFPFYKCLWRFAGLVPEFRLLVTNPSQL
jgi:hypothetical protein